MALYLYFTRHDSDLIRVHLSEFYTLLLQSKLLTCLQASPYLQQPSFEKFLT